VAREEEGITGKVRGEEETRSPMKQQKRERGVFEKVPGSGVWWVRYSDASGRIRREKAGTKGSAGTLYRKRKTEILQGKKLPEHLRARQVSFAELAQDALNYSRTNKVGSYRQDVYRMKALLGWLGSRAADSITPQDIERWLMVQAEEHDWKPATANRFKALLSLTFRLGMENGKTTSNPARLVRRRREDNARIRFLSTEEEQRLRAVIEKEFPQHLAELDVALNSGLRSSEQYRLTWECVDLGRHILTIPRSKNGEMRHIPMNRILMTALQSAFACSAGTGPVFVSERGGKPLKKARHWFERAVDEAKLERFTWHCLRHTFASRLVMAGVDLRTVAELLGHKTLAMTMRYAHLAPEHQLAAVEKLCETKGALNEATDTRTSTDANRAISRGEALVQ
jgi:site-specific recombinase XerD